MDTNQLGVQYHHRYMKTKIENDGLYIYDKDEKKYFYLCRYININKIATDILTGDVQIEIEYIHNQEVRTMILPREVFVKNKLLNELPAKGIDVTDKNVIKVLDYLLYSEQHANHLNFHEQVGWEEIEGNRVFLLQDIYGINIQSEYKGDLNICPKGTYEEWKALMEEEVIGNHPLELALVLGLSSPLASLLKKLLGLDVLFFHIYGNSTTGKTTALSVATSTFGYPSKSNNGLVKTWLATNNAMLGYLSGINGLPMAIDEASVRRNADYTKMIYEIVDGIEKARANKNGRNQERREWSGTVLSTAENSLLGNSNHNNGLRVRLLELGHLQWTSSANNAERLKRELLNNYGHAGIKFIRYLMSYKDEEIIEAFKKSKEKVMETITIKDEFTDRIADKIAVIYLTALFTKKALDLNISPKAILEILIEADAQQAGDRKLHFKAYEHLKTEIIKNLNKFIYKDNLETYSIVKKQYKDKILPNGEILGRIEMQDNTIHQVLLPKEQLKRILYEGGFTDIDSILIKWRDENLIDADKGKFTRKRKLFDKGISQRVIVININCDLDEEEE